MSTRTRSGAMGLTVIGAVVLALCHTPVGWAQSHYRWVDKQGNVHLTQSPPPPGAEATPPAQTPVPKVDAPKPAPPASRGAAQAPTPVPAPTPATGQSTQSLVDAAIKADNAKNYPEAVRLFEQALRQAERSGDVKLVAFLNGSIGDVMFMQRKFPEAEMWYRKALPLQEKALGPEDLDTLQTAGRLGKTLGILHKYGDAEALFRRVLAGRERRLGPNDAKTIRAADDLSIALGRQGKYAEAEVLVRRVLTAYDRSLGPTHADTLGAVRNLADVLAAQGKDAEAQQLRRRLPASSKAR